MIYIDTHAHIEQIENLDEVLKFSAAAGVTAVMAMSVDLPSMQKTLDIAKNYQQPKIYPALGVHPGLVKPELFKDSMSFIRNNIHLAKAIGETGLDYWYKWVRKDTVERAKQHQFYEAQLSLAKEFDLPIVIHSRGAWRDCLAMAKQAGVSRALFHWYSGPIDMLTQILDAGFFVSTSISVAYSPESQAAMREAPIERILIETDSPVSYKQGDDYFKANPSHVALTLKALAQLKKVDEVELSHVVNANAVNFFRLDTL